MDTSRKNALREAVDKAPDDRPIRITVAELKHLAGVAGHVESLVLAAGRLANTDYDGHVCYTAAGAIREALRAWDASETKKGPAPPVAPPVKPPVA